MSRTTLFKSGELSIPEPAAPNSFSETERLGSKLRIQNKRRCVLIFHLFVAIFGCLAILVNSIQTEINHNRFWNYDTSLSQGASNSDKKIVIALGQITSLICVAMAVLNSIRFMFKLKFLADIDRKILLNARKIIKESWKVENMPQRHYRHKIVQGVDTDHKARVRSQIGHFIVECVIIVFHAPSYVINTNISFQQQNFTINYGVDVLLSMLNLCKIYFLVTYLLASRQWVSAIAIETCHLQNFYPSYFFVLRCQIKQHPKLITSLAIILSVVVCGYMIRAAQIPYIPQSGQDWLPLSNAGWYIIITMTTVGYGDFFPATHLGRIIGLGVGLWGSFLISFFVVMIGVHFSLSHSERKIFERIKEEQMLHKKFLVASELLTVVLNHNRYIQKGDYSCGDGSRVRSDVDKMTAELHSLRVRLDHFTEQISNQTSLIKFYQKLIFEIDLLLRRSEEIIAAKKEIEEMEDLNMEVDNQLQNAEVTVRRMEQQIAYIEQNEHLFYGT